MRVLIFGATGMLGTDLVRSAPRGTVIDAPEIDEIDITKAADVARALDRSRPEWVVNAAAFAAVDRAEAEQPVALAVNGDALEWIGAECSRRGMGVLHFSTDYVFPGTDSRPYIETDAVLPVNAYGRSKLAGEHALLASGARALILRTQWLFGLAGRSFPRTMWDRARAGLPTRVVNDQIGRPTYTRDLAAVTWRLLHARETGILHVTNSGPSVSWFELAREVFRRAGAESLLSSCTTAEYPTPAKRPAYSVLGTSRLESILPDGLPAWPDALSRFLDELEAGDGGVDDAAHPPANRVDGGATTPRGISASEATKAPPLIPRAKHGSSVMDA